MRIAATTTLTAAEFDALDRLRLATWPHDTTDVASAPGGVHVFELDRDGEALSQALLIERELHCDGVAFTTGFVETVCTRTDVRRRGLATKIMRHINELIRASYPLGGLSTGSNAFYEALGWETWLGPSAARMPDGSLQQTPEEDGGIMVLRTPATESLDLHASITCEWRAGEIW